MAAKETISPSPTCVASFSRSSTTTNQPWNTTQVPFEECNQLYKDLKYTGGLEKPPRLCSQSLNRTTLPDAPRIHLEHMSEVVAYCLRDLNTPELSKLDKKIWRAAPNPEVVSLSQNAVLDRRIQVTEDPSVHLLWVEGIIYIKPLPAYLASFAFWEFLADNSNTDLSVEEREKLITTSLGFLRTYANLVQHRSDFNLARRHDLLGSFGNTSFESFIRFISSFDTIPDNAVSPRWRYGLIQLDALNFHSAIHLRRWHLNRFESRYSTYFSRFFPVVLFMFALFSVMLSAMQVIISARQLWETDNKGLKMTLSLFVWFGTEAIGWSMGFGVIFVIWWICISTNEAFKRRKLRRKVEKRMKNDDIHL